MDGKLPPGWEAIFHHWEDGSDYLRVTEAVLETPGSLPTAALERHLEDPVRAQGIFRSFSLLSEIREGFEKTLELDPRHSNALLSLARMDEALPRMMGGLQEARQVTFPTRARAGPHFTRAMLDYAEFLDNRGHEEEGLELVNRALAEKPPKYPGALPEVRSTSRRSAAREALALAGDFSLLRLAHRARIPATMLRSRLSQAMLTSSAMSLIALSFLVPAGPVSAEGRDSSRIVNGLTTHNFPTTGMLLWNGSGNAESATILCSGTLIGCQTFLTAAHCVEGDLNASHYFILLQHGGIIGATSVTQHPSYVDANFPIADVAVIKLDTQVTGIDPSEINQTDPEPFIPEPGTIVGFGITDGFSDDWGIKRAGGVVTTNCGVIFPSGAGNTEVICWDYENPVGEPGDDSNTCFGDSGGPLFLDLGSGQVVAGVTSGGNSNNCTPTDHSYDANVYTYRTFVLNQLGADSTSACGSIGEVGDPNTTVLEHDGSLSPSFSFVLSGGVSELRVVLNGEDNFNLDSDLYVSFGSPATTSNFDCKADGANPHGACSFVAPSAGTWYVLVNRASGSGDYQITATIFGGEPPEPPVCGNNIIEFGEGCDDGNTDSGDGCDESCQVESVVCPATPLDGCKNAGRSVLRIKDRAADGLGVNDRVIWKWLDGPATTQDEFADPINTSNYSFCIYTGSTPTTVMESEAPAGGTCGTKGCWREFSTRGYRYSDKAASADGIFKILLKTGSAGKSKIVVSGRGANLPSTTTLPLDSSAGVIVQLRNSEKGNCWEERFPPLSIVKNTPEQFKAKTP